MKQIIAILLACAVLLCAFPVVSAAETEKVEVPKIYITTAGGNGTTLQKADGYVDGHVTITDSEETVIDKDMVVKVRGNSTAMVAKKPYTFKFDKKQDLFGMGKSKKWVLLANAFDPTFLRNYLAFEMANELGIENTSRQRYVELWLDGSFRGCYTLMTPVKADIDDEKGEFTLEYERSRVDDDTTYITSKRGLRFGVNDPDEPDEAMQANIKTLIDQLDDAVASGDRERMEAIMDMPSFVKYYVLNEFLKTNDFDFSSVFFYYRGGKFHAGPPWDYDLTMGNVNKDFSPRSAVCVLPEGLYISDKLYYAKLCTYDWFNLEVRREYARHADYFRSLFVEGGRAEQLIDMYGDVFARNYKEAGWHIYFAINVMMRPYPTYQENVDYLLDWGQKRCAWLEDYFKINEMYYTIGDCDGNGTVSIEDVTLLQRLLSELEADPDGEIAMRGSVNGEKLSITDATEIQIFLAGYEVTSPVGKTGIR